VILVFFLSRILPGDITTVFVSPQATPALREQLRVQFGLDRPALEQFLLWFRSALTGEFGFSFSYKVPVTEVLAETLGNTALLGVVALAMELAITVLFTYVAVRYAGARAEQWMSNGLIAAYSIPTVWIGLIVLSLFAFRAGLFPSSQMFSAGYAEAGMIATAIDFLWHAALPALTIAIPGACLLTRYLVSSIQTVRQEDFVLAAKSMGLPQGKIFRSYILPNATGPAVSLIGVEIGLLLSGAVVTETLFSWPGVGRVTVTAIFARDYPLLLGSVLCVGVLVIAGNLVADIIQHVLDPRLRSEARTAS